MITVCLTADTRVFLEKGSRVEVNEREAERLSAFGVAIIEKKTAPKKAVKKKG